MPSVTTKEEQRRAGKVARHVGGYSELLRLARERKRLGADYGHFYRDDSGRYQIGVLRGPDIGSEHKGVIVTREAHSAYRKVKGGASPKKDVYVGYEGRITKGEHARDVLGAFSFGADKKRR